MREDHNISVRPITSNDISHIANYWLCSNQDHLTNMGVELSKLPSENQLNQMLTTQIETPLLEKKSFALICCKGEKPIGHCNIVDIKYGIEAYMHLHLWENDFRQKGVGTIMVTKAVQHFFNSFNLIKIISEPYSLNPAPHKVLLRVGFIMEKEYITTPGSLSFRQKVVRYVLTKKKFEAINGI